MKVETYIEPLTGNWVCAEAKPFGRVLGIGSTEEKAVESAKKSIKREKENPTMKNPNIREI